MSGTGSGVTPIISDSGGPTGDQVELVLLITVAVITLVFLMAIGICCCFPRLCSGVATDEEKETSRKLRTPGTPPPPADKGGPLGALTATDPGTKSTKTSNTTKTYGTTTTSTSSSTKTSTKLDKYFKKEDRRVIPPPPGPPKTTGKIKISKLNALPSRKGPAPQPPIKKPWKSPPALKEAKSLSEDDTYANQMKPHVKSISQYSMFQKGKANANSSPTKSNPVINKPSTPRPTSSSPRPVSRNSSVIKRTVAPSPKSPSSSRKSEKKRSSSRKVEAVPTVLIAPSDYEHIFSSKEKVVPKQLPKAPSSGPKEETTSTFFNNIKSNQKQKRQAPNPPPTPKPPPTPISPPQPPPNIPKPEIRPVKPAPSFPPVDWDVPDINDDDVTEIKTQPSDELFRAMFKGHDKGAENQNQRPEKVPSPPTIGDQTPTDPALGEAINQAINQESGPDQSPENQRPVPTPPPQDQQQLQPVTASPSSQSVGSRKEQFDKLKNIVSKIDKK